MPVIKLTGFTGEQPRTIPRLMAPAAAQSAINSRLDDGGLTPMRKSAILVSDATASWLSIYKHLGDWLGWDTVVNAAPGPVAEDRLYYTGDGAPKLRYNDVVYGLAIPPPAVKLGAALSGSGGGASTTRLYVYTWVTSLGEESEPSPVSDPLDYQPGYTVTLSGFGATPADRLVTSQRIYRSQTGQSGTYFYLIAERSAGTGNYVDSIPVDAFQEALPSAEWNAPPAGLTGLTAMPAGMMAAFVGKKLYFCEPYRPHAWPEKYVVTMDSEIVGLGAAGGSLIVMTKKQPYLVTGSSPETMQSVKIEQNYPCTNARGIVDLGYAIAYPSNDGMVVARADGSIGLATANIFSPKDWQALSPATMVGGQLNGRYVAFYRTTSLDGGTIAGALMFDLSGQASFLIRAAAAGRAATYDDETGALYYLDEGTTQIKRLDAPGAGRLDQYWKSKEFVLPYADNFGAILVEAVGELETQDDVDRDADIAEIIARNELLLAAGPIGGDIAGDAPIGIYAVAGDALELIPPDNAGRLVVGVYADGVLVASVTGANRIVRLPGGFTARKWEIDVFGNQVVEQITMAKTVDELKAGT